MPRSPSRDELVQVWGDGLLASLPDRARARFRVGRFTDVDGATAVFALPNETHRSYCEEVRLEVETALGGPFGTAVPIRLVVDDERPRRARGAAPGPAVRSRPQDSGAGPPPPEAAEVPRTASPAPTSPTQLTRHPTCSTPPCWRPRPSWPAPGSSPEERLKQAFPGAEEV